MDEIGLLGNGIKKGLKIQSNILDRIKKLGISVADHTAGETLLADRKGAEIENTDMVAVSPLTANRNGTGLYVEREVEEISATVRNLMESRYVPDDSCGVTTTAQVLPECSSPKITDGAHTCPVIWQVSDALRLFEHRHCQRMMSKEQIDSSCKSLTCFMESESSHTYLVLTTDTPAKSFKRARPIELFEFDVEKMAFLIEELLLLQRLFQDVRLVLEISRKTPAVSLYVASCILLATKAQKSAEIALSYLCKVNPQWEGIEQYSVAQRYASYFTTYFSSAFELKFRTVRLHQLILYCPLINDTRPNPLLLRIVDRQNNSSYRFTETYKDSSFSIFSRVDREMAGECKFEIFEQGKNGSDCSTVSFQINAAFHQQGVFRLGCSDVSSLRTKLDDGNEFFLDLIFVETESTASRLSTVLSSASMRRSDGIRTAVLERLSSSIVVSTRSEIARDLSSAGYHGSAAELATKVSSSLEDALSVLKRITSLLPREGFGNDGSVTGKDPLAYAAVKNHCLDRILEVSDRDSASLLDQLKPLEEITEIDFPEAAGERRSFRSFLNRRAQRISDDTEVFATVRALHWSPLVSVEGTIFEADPSERKIVVNIARFEKLFCYKATALKVSNKAPEEQRTVLGDARRLFLVSLSIKHLTRRGIDIQELISIIHETPNRLSLQDLLNIERIFPTEREKGLLMSAKGTSLSSEEQVMLEISLDDFASSIIRILIFERKTRDELEIIEAFIDRTRSVLSLLLESKLLKLVLMAVLEIGNMINRSHKKVVVRGFRLESLPLLCSYIGQDGSSLIRFLIEVLDENKVEIVDLFTEFSPLMGSSVEEFEKTRARINALIAAYNELGALIKTIPAEKTVAHAPLMTQIMESLGRLREKYRECSRLAGILRRKFSEDKNVAIDKIVSYLKVFLKELQNEYYKTKKVRL